MQSLLEASRASVLLLVSDARRALEGRPRELSWERRARMRACVEATTPGPWRLQKTRHDDYEIVGADAARVRHFSRHEVTRTELMDTLVFMARCRTDILRLLDFLES